MPKAYKRPSYAKRSYTKKRPRAKKLAKRVYKRSVPRKLHKVGVIIPGRSMC